MSQVKTKHEIELKKLIKTIYLESWLKVNKDFWVKAEIFINSLKISDINAYPDSSSYFWWGNFNAKQDERYAKPNLNTKCTLLNLISLHASHSDFSLNLLSLLFSQSPQKEHLKNICVFSVKKRTGKRSASFSLLNLRGKQERGNSEMSRKQTLTRTIITTLFKKRRVDAELLLI